MDLTLGLHRGLDSPLVCSLSLLGFENQRSKFLWPKALRKHVLTTVHVHLSHVAYICQAHAAPNGTQSRAQDQEEGNWDG